MFSTDQWIFAAIFLIAFIVILVFSYRKDLRQNRTYFKNAIWILVGFIVFILLILVLKLLLKN